MKTEAETTEMRDRVMKATFNRKVLQAAFSVASQASPTSTPKEVPKEVLKNVLLTASGSDAYLSASDGENSIRVKVPSCECSNGGAILLPASRFKAILSTVDSDEVSISTEGTKCKIKAGRSSLELTTIDPDTFPAVNEFAEKEYRVIAGHTLKEAIQRTVFATDTQSSRFALGGVLFDFRDNKTCFVGTDTRRMAAVEVTMPSDEPRGDAITGVVPAAACRLLERCIEGDEDVLIAFTGNDVRVKCGNSTVTARLVDGRFPRWEEVIPDDHEFSVTLPCGQLMSAINQASLVLSADSKGIDFHFDEGELKLTGVGQDVGGSEVELPVAWEHKAISIMFNGRLILDFLKTLDANDPVELLLIDENSAGVFTTGNGYRYVVMPLAKD